MLNREIMINDETLALCMLIEADKNLYVMLQEEISGKESLYLNPNLRDSLWAACLKTKETFSVYTLDGIFIGTVDLMGDKETPEIGISILKEHQNKGLSSKIIKLLVKYSYNPEKIKHYIIRIKENNTHSRHVFEKLGAKYIKNDVHMTEKLINALKESQYDDEGEKKAEIEKLKKLSKELDEKYGKDPKILIYHLIPTNEFWDI